ncbi:MAG: DUF2470 domain-containing protein [Streptosporangiales bacterium]|nr:DUF2470 domain-containing protein [Streptosporangiales bacterium]
MTTLTDRLPRWPTPAETARTLVFGVVPGTLLVPASGGPGTPHAIAGGPDDIVLKARPYTGASSNEIVLLVEESGEPANRLRTTVTDSRHQDAAAFLDLLDVPPVRTDLPRARLCVAGWVEPLGKEEQRKAALDAATSRPAGELLTVGHGASLYRLHPAELSLTRSDGTYDVAVEEFRDAEPDPVYENEQEITGHLQQHHYDDLTQWAMARLNRDDRRTLREVTITGIDRYGLDLACVTARGCQHSRISFAAPVSDEDALGDALQELRRCPCEPPA